MMATPTIQSISIEFNPATDSVTHYLQRVNLYFAANKIEDDLKAATLLSSIGVSTYARLCDLVAPDEPGKQTLDQISSLLKKHYKPTRVQIAERFTVEPACQAPTLIGKRAAS